MRKYIIDGKALTGSSVFLEASREELRVLLALMAKDGVFESTEELANLAQTTKARALSALTLFEEEGIIKADSGTLGSAAAEIIEEFEERITKGMILEEPTAEVAKSIRCEALAELFEELCRLMGTPSFSTPESKAITALVTQYSLSPDYIATLATHMKDKSRSLTVNLLVNKAIHLSGKGIDSTERLEEYLKSSEKMSAATYEYCRVIGLHRKLSDSEIAYFVRWDKELGYSVEIVKEAFNIATINTSKVSIPYMDKVLTAWHAAGCKTVEDCKRESEKGQKLARTSPKKGSKTQPEPPRYGDFDVEDAFMKALERSYSTEDKK